MPAETRGEPAQCVDTMTTPDDRAARRRAWQVSNPVTPGTVEKPVIDMPDAADVPPEKATPQAARWRGILERIGAGLVLLALSPLIIGLAPIWVPLNWYQNRQWRKDMARPRGCLTYRMTPEQLEYFEAQLARERAADAEGMHRD